MPIATTIKPLEVAELTGSPGDEPGSHPVDIPAFPLNTLLPPDVRCDPTPALQPFLLGSLRDRRLRVVAPIPVQFRREGQQVVAEAVDLDEFGFGENPSDAVTDLQRAIAELYFGLEKDAVRLGSDLNRVWRTLGATLQRDEHKSTGI